MTLFISKKLKVILQALILLLAYALTSKAQNSQEDQKDIIHRVETSLCPQVHIIGDSIWSIEERMKYYGVPGVSIAVIHDFKISWSKAWGIMDRESKEPVKSNTLFQAGSISKPVTAYAVLYEIQQGKLQFDENVNNYLRSWKIPDNDFTKNNKVTLKELLTHSGGITVHGFAGYPVDSPVPTLLQVLDGAPPANSEPIRVDELPGKEWRYSGGGYTIMQQLLIDMLGKSFPQIMEEMVLRPLDMNSSTYQQPLPTEKIKLAATGYLPDRSEVPGKRHTYPEMAA